MKHPSLLASALILGVLVFVVGAGDDCIGQTPIPDLSEVSLEQLGSIQVYSASKHLQQSSDAPSSVTVITSAEIEKQGYRTLADILRTVRSFYITYDRNYSSVGVRGFARPGDFNTRVLLLVNGHRLNDNIYDEAMIGSEFPIDIDLIQRIEILRGPVSSLYGSNALFAVINIISKRAEDLDGIELSAQAASLNTYKGRISYGRALGRLKVLFSGSFYGSRGQNQLYYPEFDASQSNNGIASHADDDQLGTAFASISSRDWTLEGAYGTREKGIPTGAYGTVFNNSGTRTTDSHLYADLSYKHTFAGSWAALARVFYDRYTYQGTYIYPSASDSAKTSPNLDFGDGKWWGTEFQVAKTVLTHNQLTIGGEYRDNFRQNQINYSLNPYALLLDDRRTSMVGALYLQDELAISKSLALNAGFRYDYYSSVRASTDPRAALIFRPSSNTALKFVYGEAFRVPNVFERFYSVPPDLPNSSLKPEKIRSAEFVLEQTLSEHLWLSTSAFRDSTDALITQESINNDLLIYRNSQKVESTGFEFEVQAQLPNGLEGTASYTFQEARDKETDQFLSNSPRDLGKIALSQPLLRKTLFASCNVQYRGGMTASTGKSLSSFTVVNFNLLGRKISKQLDLSAGLYNLLDKKYSDPPSTAVSEAAIQQDGRTFRVQLTWHLAAQ